MQLSPEGEKWIQGISERFGLSHGSAVSLLEAARRGGGTMAQFSCPEFGSGQWMRGGMTMVSDMFNDRLKANVNDVFSELSKGLSKDGIFEPEAGGNSSKGSFGGGWWPGDLGSPSSSGAQNGIRYAVFPQTQRLAIERNGKVAVYDTGNHRIGGVSQQQGGSTSLTFASQHGTISVDSLPVISGAGESPEETPTTNFARARAAAEPAAVVSKETGSADPVELLQKLGQLRDAGVLSEEEFAAKKKEILGRI